VGVPKYLRSFMITICMKNPNLSGKKDFTGNGPLQAIQDQAPAKASAPRQRRARA
jgi:hypothetical protein